jgi:polyisoprenoid-binding protein YceI
MKTGFILSFFFTANIVWASEVSVKVNLSPMGNFYGKTSEVDGSAKKVGDKIVADNIVVNLKSLKTGIPLRDEHTQKRLETEKFPTAVLVHGEGSGSNGTGLIRIRGIEKEIKGTYEVKGASVKAEFTLKLSDFKIKDVRYLGAGAKDEIKLEVTVPLK